MDELADIKRLWLSADTSILPEPARMRQKIDSYRKRQLVKSTGLVVMSLILVSIMTWVLFAYHSLMLSTRLGEAMMMLAMLIVLSTGVGSVRRVSRLTSCTNDAFLAYLKLERRRQIAFQRKTQRLGFALASLGLALYIFEMAAQTGLLLGSYAGLAVFLTICWFVVRPYAARKKALQSANTIAVLERLSHQLNDNIN